MKVVEASLQDMLARNRAEELGYDLWKHFVIPPYYDRLDLLTARKPRLIVGGRGCGKTMLVRYLSHDSMFSPDRPRVPESARRHIGLYWRADTQFANLMSGREIADSVWLSAFSHMAALILATEVLQSLDSLARRPNSQISSPKIETLKFTDLRAYDSNLPTTKLKLGRDLRGRLRSFESWVSDVRKIEEPRFLPGERFIRGLIETVQDGLPALRDHVFHVYIDEYESLTALQKRLINTWLKMSEPPLIFNLAMKRNSFDLRDTLGPESLSDVHDFRQHDLEEYLREEKYQLFLAEVLFLHLQMAGVSDLPVDVAALRDPDRLEERRLPDYAKRVLSKAAKFLPDVSEQRQAEEVMKDPALAGKLRERIQIALSSRGLKGRVDRYMRTNLPQASIVTPALLSRRQLRPEVVAGELDKLEGGEENKFTGATDWIHNNFVGSLLQLYEPYSRACPFYAGFHTYCHLARGNVRHFLELCHQTIYRVIRRGESISEQISWLDQAEAARSASYILLKEIRSFGPNGNQLHTFVHRLGSLFAVAHRRPSQSESEQNHFSLGSGPGQLDSEDYFFLREATKWSVLFEEQGTKRKSAYEPESIEYVLNPIYSPYFNISYRKKKKIELSPRDLRTLIKGTYSEVTTLIRSFAERWEVETAPTLFSHLLTESQEES